MVVDHHAVLVCANSLSESELPEVYKTPSIDVEIIAEDRLSISAVRGIIEIANKRPVAATHRTIVIAGTSIAPEAQHALLKILEEPPATTRFMIVLPSANQLLPTLLSRLYLSPQTTHIVDTSTLDAFLALPIPKRLEIIAEKAKQKDTQWMDTVLSLTAAITNNLPLQAKQMVLTASEFGNFKGSSKKLLLEGIALSLPIKKT